MMVLPDDAADTTNAAAVINADDARRLTDQIKVAVEATWQLVIEAYESRAWAALGYPTWDDYCTREFGASRIRLPREDRSEVVSSLRDAGLSLRAIVAATGVGIGTVHRDLAPVPGGTPEPVENDDTIDAELVELAERMIGHEDTANALAAARIGRTTTVTGIDGKRYRKTTPTTAFKRKRTPLPDAVRSAGWELRKDAERLQRLRDDDRWGGHGDQMADVLREHLEFTVKVCQDMLDELKRGRS